MAGAEEGGQEVDRNLLEESRIDFRRYTPKEIRDGYRGLIVEHIEPTTHRVTKGGLIEEVPESERKLRARGIKKELSKEEGENLDELESELVAGLLADLVKPSVDRLGIQNENLVPYQETRLEFALTEINDLRKELKRTAKRVQTVETPRFDEVDGRLEKLEIWFKGYAGLLKGAGPHLLRYFDGWQAIALGVRTLPRYDTVATDFNRIFRFKEKEKVSNREKMERDVKDEVKDWKLGTEILQKQDNIYKIMRGVAAAHRHRWRHMGQELQETRGFSDIYQVNDEQMEFIELFFGHNPRDEKGHKTNNVEVLSRVFGGNQKQEIEKEIIEVFDRKRRRKLVNPDEAQTPVTIVEGKELEITKDLLDDWKGNPASLEGETLWVDGVQWEVKSGSTTKIAEELEYRIGSGDKVFVGKKESLTVDNYKKRIKKIKDSAEVAIIRETPSSLRNLYVMDQDSASITPTKETLGAMMDTGVWERLKSGEDLDRIFEDFKEELKGYKLSEIDEHLIETSRIGLLFFLEGGELGWGFAYKDDDLTYKEIEGQEDLKIGRMTRYVDMGGTKAATDISTPFFWLRTEAGNEWKLWTSGLLPMDDKIKRQILDHEPGWAPWVDKENGIWKTEFMGVTMELDTPTTFKMSFPEAAKFVDAGPELRKEVDGKNDTKTVKDVVYEGKEMSDVPWLLLREEAVYRWVITLSQLAKDQALLSQIPDREIAQTFFGEQDRLVRPGTAEILELMKRQSLAYRDMGGDDDVERFLPLAISLYMAWEKNLLPESKDPGYFSPKRVERAIALRSAVLGEMAPKGNKDMAEEMSRRLEDNMFPMIEMGMRYRQHINILRKKKTKELKRKR